MIEAGAEAECAKYAHYLSEDDINEARQLATEGRQRLRDIAETERTFFRFPASCGDHFAKATVRISPVIPLGSHYPSYEVFASYEPCCYTAQADHVDEQIKLLIQLVYDTYIQAVRRKFDDDWYGPYPSHYASGTKREQL